MTLEEMVSRTEIRIPGFAIMLDHVSRCNKPLIIETGCARLADNWYGDGMSTLIWDRAAERWDGEVRSVDLDSKAVSFARSQVGSRTKIDCSDSVTWLQSLETELAQSNRSIDLLYLDSFDFNAEDPHPSSLHHLFELLSIKCALRPGTLVAVDDNMQDASGAWIGKGRYVATWMATANKRMVHRGYQWIWEW